MAKKKKPIEALSKPALVPTVLGSGYAYGAAKKAKKRKTEMQKMLDEVNK